MKDGKLAEVYPFWGMECTIRAVGAISTFGVEEMKTSLIPENFHQALFEKVQLLIGDFTDFIQKSVFGYCPYLKSDNFGVLIEIVHRIGREDDAASITLDFGSQGTYDADVKMVIHGIAADNNDWANTTLFTTFDRIEVGIPDFLLFHNLSTVSR